MSLSPQPETCIFTQSHSSGDGWIYLSLVRLVVLTFITGTYGIKLRLEPKSGPLTIEPSQSIIVVQTHPQLAEQSKVALSLVGSPQTP
jgi:hypothetical protein